MALPPVLQGVDSLGTSQAGAPASLGYAAGMETIWWTASLLLIFLGLCGAVFPILPDSLLILAGAFLQHFTIRGPHEVGWWALDFLIALCILAHVLDFAAGAFGARRFGASKWGAFGGIVGGIVGLFFFPIGLFLGPVVGALCAEVIFAGRSLGPAVKSGWGTFLGTTAGMLAKLIIDLSMVAIFLWSTLWR